VDSYNRMVHETHENAKALALAEKENAWREMAQQVAHEIKNPLTPMRLMTQLHASKAKSLTPEEVKEYAEAMLAQIDAMSAVAGDFSELAKITTGVLRPVDLTVVLRRVQLAYPGLELAVPHGDWVVRGTEDSLLRVFNNLLNNALDAVPDGRTPSLALTVRDDEGAVLISVRDNGGGIDSARWKPFLNRILRPSPQVLALGWRWSSPSCPEWVVECGSNPQTVRELKLCFGFRALNLHDLLCAPEPFGAKSALIAPRNQLGPVLFAEVHAGVGFGLQLVFEFGERGFFSGGIGARGWHKVVKGNEQRSAGREEFAQSAQFGARHIHVQVRKHRTGDNKVCGLAIPRLGTPLGLLKGHCSGFGVIDPALCGGEF
jgi:two-component sensor histidine kinase